MGIAVSVAHELSGLGSRRDVRCSVVLDSRGRRNDAAGMATGPENANRFIREAYLPEHNARFTKPAELPDSAFVPVKDKELLGEVLCVQEERIVARDNTVSWGRLKLQLPESRLRAHYVKARVRVHQYPDARLAVFHGPRCLARYSADGEPIGQTLKAAA